MPVLRDRASGSVVNVDDATAARLGAEYEPVKPEHVEPAPKRTSKK